MTSPSDSASRTTASPLIAARRSAHSSSHVTSHQSGGPSSRWKASHSSCRTSRSSSVAGRTDTEACEEIVGREVLERSEADADRPHVLSRTIERCDRLAEPEVAPRPRLWASQMSGEEPVCGPLADAALGHESRLHLVVGQASKGLEVEVTACDSDDVLRLSAGETKRDQLLFGRERHSLAGRKAPCLSGADAKRLDQTIADGER